jgi:hypothetical protein
MTIYLTKPDGRVILMARAEGDNGMIGDALWEVRPGESAFGRTHAEWSALPEGRHEVTGSGLADPVPPN